MDLLSRQWTVIAGVIELCARKLVTFSFFYLESE